MCCNQGSSREPPRCPLCGGVVADGYAAKFAIAVELGTALCACSLADLRTALSQAHVDAGEHGRMWMEAVQAREHAERERDEARAALAEVHTTVCGGNLETPLRAAQRLARDMKAANERLATEPARIAAAEMAERVKWVKACGTILVAGAHVIRRALDIGDDGALTLWALRRDATDADIAAAIRAARGAR